MTTKNLHDAAYEGDLEAVKALLDTNAHLVSSRHSEDQATPLHMAAAWGHKEVVDLLLARGAEVNAIDCRGLTPLHWAVEKQHEDVVRLLVVGKANVNAKDCDGETPLYLAAKRGLVAVVELLLAKGADVNAQEKTGETPLHRVARRGSLDVAKLLLAAKANVNIRTKAGYPWAPYTPMYVAIKDGHPDMVELLRQHGGHE